MAHGNSNTRGQVARCARGRALATLGLIVALCACTQVTNAKKVMALRVIVPSRGPWVGGLPGRRVRAVVLVCP